MTEDVHYCSRPQDLRLFPHVGEGVRRLNDKGFKVVIITNQSGIARGYFTEPVLVEIHQKLKGDLAQYGARIDAIYHCPHHPDEGCECRKPKPKLAHQAIAELGIDPRQSYVIGDRLMDIELAQAIGSKSVLIANDLGISEIKGSSSPPDYIASDFGAAVKWIIKEPKG